MAVLSKIRERSMFLIIIIGLALFAFVLDPSTLGDFFNSSKVNEIGEIDGEAVSRQEFASELDSYKQQAGSNVSEMQAAKTVWDNIVRKKIYKKQLNEAGITIGEADVWQQIVNASFVQSNPDYQNEAGLFDEAKFKQFLANEKENKTQLWSQWSAYMNQVRDDAERNTFNSLVSAGLGASLKEGENEHLINNTKLSGQFVYVPYSSVSDSLVKIKKSEVEAYIKENEVDFKVDASRDLSFVKFEIVATAQDEAAMKSDIASLIGDFSKATDNGVFLSENGSDTGLDNEFQYKNFVNKEIADEIYTGNKNDIIGPYKDKGFFKLSKITEVIEMPDSVKASHILVPFVGAQRVAADITRTEEQAEKLADSILKVVQRRGSKFVSLAKEYSSDKSNSDKGGELDWFNYSRMTTAFRDFAFTNKKGAMEVVKTPFGFHIVKITDQKNKQKVLKLATYSRKIVASEATENNIYRNAEQFALEVSKGDNFFDTAKDNKYSAKPVVGIKVLDENVPGLGKERQIVSWAFGKDTKVGSFKRFDLDGSHVVATVTGVTEKGLMPVGKATGRVRPILLNKKKAAILAEKFNGSSLEDIAKANNITVKSGNDISLKTLILPGVGSEPKIVGAMYNAEINKVYKEIAGNRGVFAFKLTNKELPTALPNYETNRKRIVQTRKSSTFKVYEAIKKSSKIEDNRASMYSAN
jgi:peptidylprolyl isomerase/peptidyl-prolyl cis-trans isomerase D